MKEKRYRNVSQFMKFPAKVRFCVLVPKLFRFPQNLNYSSFNIIHAVLDTMLKVAFFRKCDSFFKYPKKNIPKNYPELEI